MQSNVCLYLKKYKGLIVLISITVISVFIFDLVSYLRIPPALQIAKMQTIMTPIKTEFLGENFEHEYLKNYPVGTYKSIVIESFEISDFKITESNPNLTGHIDPYFNPGMQYYWGVAKFPAGLINTYVSLGIL